MNERMYYRGVAYRRHPDVTLLCKDCDVRKDPHVGDRLDCPVIFGESEDRLPINTKCADCWFVWQEVS